MSGVCFKKCSITSCAYIDYFHSVVDIFKSGIWEQFADVSHPDLQLLAQAVPDIAIRSRQDGTVKGYLAGFKRWKAWANKYTEIKTLPADAKYVSLYLTSVFQSSKTHAPVTNAYYSISWAHKVACLPDPTTHDIVKRIKESAARVLGTGDNAKCPISSDCIVALTKKYSHVNANLKDLRIVCICLLAFSGFLRYDEFSNVLVSDVAIFDTHMTVFVEKSKTDIYRDGVKVYISKTNTLSCPVYCMQRYISAAGFDSDSQEFLFRGLTYHRKRKVYTLRKQNKGMSYTCTREVVLSAFASIGLSVVNFGTHSLRKGGATAASCHSVNDRLIKKHGRWSSEKSKDLYISEGLNEKLCVTKNLGI